MISFVYNSEFGFCSEKSSLRMWQIFGESLSVSSFTEHHMSGAVGEFIYLTIRSNVYSSAVDDWQFIAIIS